VSEDRFVCGVPEPHKVPARIVEQDTKWTVVECDEHNAFTRHDTTPREEREQQIIRVQDKWRQHGVSPTPKR
jgi:hypothetical protein